jgi:hypothetical protein
VVLVLFQRESEFASELVKVAMQLARGSTGGIKTLICGFLLKAGGVRKVPGSTVIVFVAFVGD